MNRTRVKICGVTTAEDRDVAVAAGADAVGCIVDVPVETPREIPVEQAKKLLADLPPFVAGVLVTMPTGVDEVVELQERVGAEVLQVHGGLAPEHVERLSDRLTGKLRADVVAAVDAYQEDIEAYATAGDALLVDSTTDDGAGGTGETHDWNRTRELVDGLDTPVALAGGLTPENVSEAIETVEPFLVDTASGVEREDGKKDPEAVSTFVSRAVTNTVEESDSEKTGHTEEGQP